MARRALSVLVLALALLPPSKLTASPPSALRVEVSVCPGAPLDALEIARAVRVELEADGVVRPSAAGVTSDPAAPADGTLHTDIACDTTLSAQIHLRAAITGRESQRQVLLADASPGARVGVVALLASELVRSDWLVLSGAAPSVARYPSDAPAPAPSLAGVDAAVLGAPTAPLPAIVPSPVATRGVDTATSPGQRDRGAAARQPWTLSGDVRLRWFVDYASLGLGGDVGADSGAWRLRAEALLSSSRDVLGSAAVGSAAAAIGYRVLQTEVGPFTIASYPMAATGVTWMRGRASDASVRVKPATGLYADLRLVTETRLTGSASSPTLAVELGRATGFVARSEGRDLAATGGFFVGANAGARY